MADRGRKRLAKESIQEQISRSQFSEHIMKYGGWLSDKIEDLGEDFLVRIYEEGIWTGISFFVQLKSTPNIEKLRIKNNQISYPFKVKDILHWSSSAAPVFLIIWDVNRRTGYWISVLETIAQLNERNKGWQNKASVKVWIPFENETNDAGLTQIRRFLANYYLPSLSQGRNVELELSLDFPNNPTGEHAAKAVEHFLATGDTVEIDREFIKEVRFSDWYSRIAGKRDITQIILASTPSEASIPTRIDVITRNGTVASLPYINLRAVKGGSKEITISNEDQPTAVHIKFTINLDLETNAEGLLVPKDLSKAAINFNFRPNHNLALNVLEMRDAVLFFNGVAEGVALRLITLATASVAMFPNPNEVSTVTGDSGFIDLIEKLCFIQEKMGCWLTLKQWSIADEEAQLINELTEIIKVGHIVWGVGTTQIVLDKNELEIMIRSLIMGNGIKYTRQNGNTSVELFGTNIEMGPSTWEVIGVPQLQTDELKQIIETLDPNTKVAIDFIVHASTFSFSNWPKTSFGE
ncbi:MAG: DUF4365 domain-containing protein [Chloroflexota bacterium]